MPKENVVIPTKQCKDESCLKEKPVTEFYKGKNKDGYQSYCKECTINRGKTSMKDTKIWKEKLDAIPVPDIEIDEPIKMTHKMRMEAAAAEAAEKKLRSNEEKKKDTILKFLNI